MPQSRHPSADTRFADLVIKPFARPPGAEVLGLDASRMEAREADALRQAMAQHGVLLLRDQDLTPKDLVRLSEFFGEIEPPTREQFSLPEQPEIFVISNVVENGRPIGSANDDMAWHTDQVYFDRPTAYTFLYGIETPAEGADTLFCETYELYDELDAATRERYAGIEIEYSHNKLFAGRLTPEQMLRHPDVIHPLVRTHPVNGRKSLYFGRRKLSQPLGMEQEEGLRFLDRLNERATRPERVYTHKWQPGDLLMWDNRGLLHSATPYDQAKHRRIVHRTSVIGEKPY